jgi:large subunit ribosomal protein L4
MLKVNVYSIKGTKLSDYTLPKNFQLDVNLDLLAQAKRVYEDGAHPGLRKAKTRSEVIRTKKKVYKQKGTGGARHGSKNAPIFVGGGVAHGPRPLRRVLELPKKMKEVALNMAVALKAKNGEVVLVDGVKKIGKTNEAASFLSKVSKEVNFSKFTFASAGENSGALNITF